MKDKRKTEMTLRRTVRLCPTRSQERIFKRWAGIKRFAYNEAKAFSDKIYRLTGKTVSFKAIRQHLRALRDLYPETSWLSEAPECVIKRAARDFVDARQSFLKGEKKAPRFKKKGRVRLSFFMRGDTFRNLDKTHVKMTGLPSVRHKGYSFPEHMGDIRIFFDGKYWMLSFVESVPIEPVVTTDNVLGIDLGLKAVMTTSEGDCYSNISKTKEIRRLECKKKHLQREIARKYRVNGSYKKTKNIIKIEKKIRRVERRLRNIRDTYNHEIAKNIVSKRPRAIVLEDLNIKGMMRNRHLSKSIQDAGLYDLKQKITYKAELSGIPVIVVDRFYPSSKTCSQCGYKKKDLKLSERTYVCSECGSILDRDHNAAINLKHEGERLLA